MGSPSGGWTVDSSAGKWARQKVFLESPCWRITYSKLCYTADGGNFIQWQGIMLEFCVASIFKLPRTIQDFTQEGLPSLPGLMLRMRIKGKALPMWLVCCGCKYCFFLMHLWGALTPFLFVIRVEPIIMINIIRMQGLDERWQSSINQCVSRDMTGGWNRVGDLRKKDTVVLPRSNCPSGQRVVQVHWKPERERWHSQPTWIMHFAEWVATFLWVIKITFWKCFHVLMQFPCLGEGNESKKLLTLKMILSGHGKVCR